jgi:alkylhydroperoxidase/carboxymuconolactone decarboxylase family protein YurZ
MTTQQETAATSHQIGGGLRERIPGVYAGLVAAHRAAILEPGALDTSARELIALAISVGKRCESPVAPRCILPLLSAWLPSSPATAGCSGPVPR